MDPQRVEYLDKKREGQRIIHQTKMDRLEFEKEERKVLEEQAVAEHETTKRLLKLERENRQLLLGDNKNTRRYLTPLKTEANNCQVQLYSSKSLPVNNEFNKKYNFLSICYICWCFIYQYIIQTICVFVYRYCIIGFTDY